MKTESLSTEEYAKLKSFMGLYFDWYMASPNSKPETHPLLILEATEKKSLSQAKRGLEMAINDSVEMSNDWTPEQVAEADKKFAKRGLPTLSKLRRRYSRKYSQVLKRGSIKSVQEYYLLKGIADDLSIGMLPLEREKVGSMLNQYEKLVTEQNSTATPGD